MWHNEYTNSISFTFYYLIKCLSDFSCHDHSDGWPKDNTTDKVWSFCTLYAGMISEYLSPLQDHRRASIAERQSRLPFLYSSPLTGKCGIVQSYPLIVFPQETTRVSKFYSIKIPHPLTLFCSFIPATLPT